MEFLTANGRFWPDQASPIFLERYEPEKEQPWCSLIQATGKLIRGDGDLDWYTICYEAYQHKLQANKAAEDVATDHKLFGL